MQWGKGKVTNKKPLTPVVALVELGREEGEMILRMPSRKKDRTKLSKEYNERAKNPLQCFSKLATNNALFVGGENYLIFSIFQGGEP